MRFIEIGDNLVNTEEIASICVEERKSTFSATRETTIYGYTLSVIGRNGSGHLLSFIEYETIEEAQAALKKLREYLEKEKLFDRKII